MQTWKSLVTYLRIDRLLASWNILGSAGTTPASVAQIYCERFVTVVLSNFQNQRVANPMRG
jgi:hypothetical protein